MSAVAEERWRACQPSVGEKIHHFDYAIRFLLQAADYCIWEDDYNSPYYQFVAYCEEAISLARKYGFEYVLEETFFLKSWGNRGKCLKNLRGIWDLSI